MEHAAWTAGNALAACDTAAVTDGLPVPGMAADVDAHGAIEGADAALDAAGGVGHHPRRGQGLAATFFAIHEMGR